MHVNIYKVIKLAITNCSNVIVNVTLNNNNKSNNNYININLLKFKIYIKILLINNLKKNLL